MDIKRDEVWLNGKGELHLIIYAKARGTYPIITLFNGESGNFRTFTSAGSFWCNRGQPELNLIRKAPTYDDWEIDKKVVVNYTTFDPVGPAHWAGINEKGNPSVWAEGRTSHTSSARIEVVKVSPVEAES